MCSTINRGFVFDVFVVRETDDQEIFVFDHQQWFCVRHFCSFARQSTKRFCVDRGSLLIHETINKDDLCRSKTFLLVQETFDKFILLVSRRLQWIVVVSTERPFVIPGLNCALEDQGRIWSQEDVGNLPFSKQCATRLWRTVAQRSHVTVAQRPSSNQQTMRDKVMEDCRATSPRDCRATIPRDCRATTVDQSANGA